MTKLKECPCCNNKVPNGYKLVPLKANLEMVMAGTKEFVVAQKAGLGTPQVADIFAAMVDVVE